MNMRYFIGLDNGGSVTKAGLFDEHGNELAVSSVLAKPITPRMNYVERDTNELIAANFQCIKDVIAKSGVSPQDIKAVSVTGHGNGLYLVGFDGKPSYNGIISTDTRAASYVHRWYSDGTIDKVLPKTKQMIWAGQLTPLLAWFKDNAKDILDQSKYAFTVTDLVRFYLTGEAYGEITNMSSISAMNLETRDYDDEIFACFGISEYRRLFSPIRLSHDICGCVTQQASELTGLLCGTPVAGGIVDFSACPIATGVTREDQLSIVAGTWSINSYVSKKPVQALDLFMSSLYPMNDFYLIMEGSMTSASNLEWFVQKIMKEEQIEAAKSGQNIYKICDEMIAQLPPEESPVIFLPFLFGTNVNDEAKSCFLGINFMHDKVHLLRAVYEGVVFSTMMHVENLMKYRKKRPTVVRISGGAANSKVWVQMFADALQIPIEVANAKELGAKGVAICAAIAVGVFPGYQEAIDGFVSVKSICQPDPLKRDIYANKYNLYKKLVNNLDGVWKEWKNIYK